MAKTRVEHRCSECGATTPRWEGRCPGCGRWNSLVEQVVAPVRRSPDGPGNGVVLLRGIDPAGGDPRETGIEELDRALGGGLVPGSVTLIGGEPGIGKSTLLLQVASELSSRLRKTVIASAEESAEQISRRALRLGVDNAHIMVCATSSLSDVLEVAMRERPE